MSGGSYDYLYAKEVDELFNCEWILQQMADKLARLGYATDAAAETEEILLTLRQFRNRLWTMVIRMSPIWKAIEWWDSGDSGEEGFKKALNEYRGN